MWGRGGGGEEKGKGGGREEDGRGGEEGEKGRGERGKGGVGAIGAWGTKVAARAMKRGRGWDGELRGGVGAI